MQSKYAFAMFGMSVKSVPGCLVAIAPSLIGVPVAATPGLSPHFEASTAAAAAPPVVAADVVLLLLLLPHALTATARPTASNATSAPDHLRSLIPLTASPPLGFDGCPNCLGARPVLHAEQTRGVVLQDQLPHLRVDIDEFEVAQQA